MMSEPRGDFEAQDLQKLEAKRIVPAESLVEERTVVVRISDGSINGRNKVWRVHPESNQNGRRVEEVKKREDRQTPDVIGQPQAEASALVRLLWRCGLCLSGIAGRGGRPLGKVLHHTSITPTAPAGQPFVGVFPLPTRS
jgi:hypothetical protein